MATIIPALQSKHFRWSSPDRPVRPVRLEQRGQRDRRVRLETLVRRERRQRLEPLDRPGNLADQPGLRERLGRRGRLVQAVRLAVRAA